MKPLAAGLAMPERRPLPVGTLALALLLAGLMLLTWLLVRPPVPPAELDGVLRAEFRPLAPFQLQSRGHGPIGLDSLRGRWTFVYFGYRSCPDVCPKTLHELGQLQRLLADQPGDEPTQVLFVSVDPERDSAEQLASYVAYFGKDFIGATAGLGALERFAQQFGAGFEYQPQTAPGQYAIEHSSAVFLVDPYARVVASFSEPHYAAALLSQYRAISGYFAGGA